MTTITMCLIKSRGRIPMAHLRTLTHAHVLILKPYTRTRRFLRTRTHTRTWTRLSHDTCVFHRYESREREQVSHDTCVCHRYESSERAQKSVHGCRHAARPRPRTRVLVFYPRGRITLRKRGRAGRGGQGKSEDFLFKKETRRGGEV